MGKKQLTWLFLLALLVGIPTLIQAKSQQMNSQGDIQGTGTAFSNGYNQGYPQGYEQGRADKGACKECPDPDVPHVKYPHCGCHDEVAEHEFKGAFRTGFERGYLDGFHGREQQPLLAADATSAPAPTEMARADVATETERTSPSSVWQNGYKIGYEGGQADQSACKKSDYDDAPGYHDHPEVECDSCMSKERAERRYKAGFKEGYEDGYNGLVSRLATPASLPPQASATIPEMPRTETTPEAAPSQMPSPTIEEAIIQETPAVQETPALPKALPKTASSLPLFGLIGLAGIALSLLSRRLRSIGKE